jgi:hypothetical protein
MRVKQVLQKCWAIIVKELSDLRSGGGMYLQINAEQYKQVVPSLLVIVSDHPEAQKMCGCPEVWNSRHPCRVCHVTASWQAHVLKRSDAGRRHERFR